MDNVLYYGDNLPVLRDKIATESVDLIYLDPPFNSKASYNVLFGGDGKSQAQIRAFDDTWHWGPEAERSFADVMQQGGRPADMLESFRRFLGDNDMMAYLAMMTPRMIELRRVLKPTGSIYLHCDPTASHYLKILMDAVFGVHSFRNEIVWDYSFRLMDLPKFFNRKHDILLLYARGRDNYFNMPKSEWTREDLIATRKQAIHIDKDGVEWIWMPGGRGHSKNKLRRVDEIIAGGKAMSDVWRMPIISSSSKERLGYPTQKPLALLERIIEASSKPGDVVLDPFCGCGTTVHAAQKLGRPWIGIDITHLAIGLIEYRLRDAFGIRPDVIGAPEDLEGARDLFGRHPFQFEAWAVTRLLGIKPNQRQTGDKGVDGIGRFYLGRDKDGQERYGKILVSVKGGQRLGVGMIRDFRGALEREKADLGVFICLNEPTREMIAEAAGAGRYREIEGRDCPRIQIFTIADHFAGRRPDLPPAIEDARRRAAVEGKEQAQLI